MAYRVIIHKADGTTENFGEFVSEYWAKHHMGIAKTPYDGNHYSRSEYDGSTWEIVETNESKHIKTAKDGDLVFISNSGIEYSMYEGISMGKQKTSDILYLMLDGYDCPTMLAFWSYGANVLDDGDIENISNIIGKWEENNRDTIDGILDGTIKKF